MIHEEIAGRVAAAARKAQEAGELPDVAVPDVAVERPQRPEHGDYATSLPLRLARAARSSPMTIAETIRRHLEPGPQVAEVSIAAPGFINLRLDQRWLTSQVNAIIAAGAEYGRLQTGAGRRIQVEYVSANPTGPLHVGNGRWAAIGSTLVNVLAAAGWRAAGEYYINDGGTQIETFTNTLYARYQQLFGRDAQIPADGYPGHYMTELAESIRTSDGERFLRPEGQQPDAEFGLLGVERMVADIRDSLAMMGVTFETWFSERSLLGSGGKLDEILALLRQRGYVTEKDSAVWFTSAQLGEDREAVLIRSTGVPTYFANDIAYHYDKFFTRGFDRVIDIWGADHQGHVPRMKAAVEALGVAPDNFEVLIGQLVTLKRGSEVVRISKRSGEIITLREVLDEVGADAARFFFLARAADSPVDFDLELAKRQSNENPVYYVQYAHARIAGILNHATERGIDWSAGDTALLGHPEEMGLIRRMLQLPEMIDSIAHNLEPHHLPYYAQDLATQFHSFYTECRVVTDDLDLTRARLRLVEAARVVLANTLGLIGVAAPERM